ncbi:MAG: hypothetical protein JWP00_4661 [Chloroflexi bacterium]|nr:hypothetical protein [Chloroflexota bacterium]
MKKQLKFWVGLVISVVAVWFALNGIQFDQVGDSFSRLNWGILALSLIPYFLNLFMKITRWQLLFSPGPKIRLGRLWATLNISYLFNTLLPARLGEIVRAYAISRSEHITPVRALSTIFLEKIMDVMTMFIFLICLLPFLKLGNDIRQAAFITGGLVVVAFVVCMLMAAFRKQAERLIRWFLRFVPGRFREPLFGLVSEVLDVLSILLNFKLSLNLWAQSLVLWLLVVINYMMVAWALNIPLNFELGMVLLIALNLGMVVPSAPGYIGVFEALVKVALLPFFPGQESMLISLGLLLHITGYLPVIIMGAFFTWREGLTLGKVPPVPDLEEDGTGTGSAGKNPSIEEKAAPAGSTPK